MKSDLKEGRKCNFKHRLISLTLFPCVAVLQHNSPAAMSTHACHQHARVDRMSRMICTAGTFRSWQRLISARH